MSILKARTATRAHQTLKSRPRTRRNRISYVTDGKRATHVILPIRDYHRLLRLSGAPNQPAQAEQFSASEIERLWRKLDDPASEWYDWEEVRARLAMNRIAAARRKAGLTQAELGKRIGLPQSQISRIERYPERTTVRTLRKLAAALGVDMGALLGGSGE